MAITTYTELEAALADWIHRSDLTSRIPDFIALAEDEINTDMRLRLMEVDETVTFSSGRTVALPSRFLEPIKLSLVYAGADDEELTYQSPAQMVVNDSVGVACRPLYWTINGDNIEFPNRADTSYTLTFRMLKGFDIASTSTNALLTKYRGLYLYGALVQASAWVGADERIGKWKSMYLNMKKKVNRQEARTKTLTLLQTDMPGTYPRMNILRG
jgi:hypothetical protein